MNRIIAILLCLVLLAGCAPVIIEAPVRGNVSLSRVNATPPTVVKKKNWYALWGLIPISNNSTASLIADKGFTEVKAKTYTSFVDCLISVLTSPITIMCNTAEVSGK